MPNRISILLILTAWLTTTTTSTSSPDVDADIADHPTVKTRTATIHGKRLDIHPHQLPTLRRSVQAFTRIPYAEPPVGELRYARPVAKVLHGDFDATRSPIACPQVFLPLWNLQMNTSEDCLFLDVFVPEPEPSAAAVMVWIHGGGYHMGAGSVPGVLPTPLAALGEVIVVTCNFRLGPLAFLATGDDAIPANLGLLDQRLVLLWVRDNIEAFGGDPQRVTLFGMSSGAGSINLHLLSPMSAGLYTGAIMQSGSVGASWAHHASMEEAVNMTFDLGKAIGCDVTTSDELVMCLRKKSVDEILAPYKKRTTVVGDFFVRPVPDGQFLPDDPRKLVAEGSFNVDHVLIGCMKEEGILSMMLAFADQQKGSDPPFLDRSAYCEVIAKHLGLTDPLTVDVTAFMYATEDQVSNPGANFLFSAGKLVGNKMTLCPTFSMSEHLSRAGRTVYTYLMTHIPSHSIWGERFGWMRAAHGEDVPYVFGSPLLLDPANDDFRVVGRFGDEQEVEMSMQIVKYWSNFAKTGDPNLSASGGEETNNSYPPWPRFNHQDPHYKELSLSFENRAGKADTKECYFLHNVLPRLLQTKDEMTHLRSLLEDSVMASSDQSCDGQNSCPEN